MSEGLTLYHQKAGENLLNEWAKNKGLKSLMQTDGKKCLICLHELHIMF